jgi:hypothetical protein
MSKKFIYEFTVDKIVEKDVPVERKPEDDPSVTATRKEKVAEPVKFRILKPTRKLYDLAEIFLAKTISDYVREGIMPITLVAKRFGDDGGVLTTKEQEYIVELQKRIDENQKKLIALSAPKKEGEPEPETISPQQRADLFVDMMKTQVEIDNIRNSYLSLYENTAEMKARKKTIEWWITQLSYHGEGEKEYFPQTSFFERYKAYVDTLDGDSDFDKKVVSKFSYLISTWFSNINTALTEEDFKAADKHFEENVADE